MTTQRFTMVSKADGLGISALLALPEGQPRGLVQLAHGMAEYKERYLPFMEALAGRGYAACIADHRGHGASVKSAGDLGWFGRAGARGVVDDMRQLTGELQARFPGLPLCLMGHSMGSLAVRAYARQDDAALTALVVSGCPGENGAAGLGLGLIRLLKTLKGPRHLSSFVDKLVNGAFAKKFPGEDSPFCWLNSDPQAVADYEADPKCGFLFTLNGYEALLTLMRMAYDKAGWRLARPDMKVLFISGGDDPCMVSREKLDSAVARMKAVGYRDVSLITYPGMRHEILLERHHEQVYRDVLTFLDQMT